MRPDPDHGRMSVLPLVLSHDTSRGYHMLEQPPNLSTRLIDRTDRPFVRHLLLIVLVAAGAFALWRLSDVLVLAFGAALLALLLRGLASVLSRRTRLPEAWAVAPVVIV